MMNEIIKGLNAWEAIRTESRSLVPLFKGIAGFNININDFSANKAIHAYPMVVGNQLKFALISENHDVVSTEAVLLSHIKVVDCVEVLIEDQIKKKEALQRIDSWKTTFISWIPQVILQQEAIYQVFYIPTKGLRAQTYKANFALKAGLNLNLKDADLVLANVVGDAFYDTIDAFPPYRDRTKHYILNLL